MENLTLFLKAEPAWTSLSQNCLSVEVYKGKKTGVFNLINLHIYWGTAVSTQNLILNSSEFVWIEKIEKSYFENQVCKDGKAEI